MDDELILNDNYYWLVGLSAEEIETLKKKDKPNA